MDSGWVVDIFEGIFVWAPGAQHKPKEFHLPVSHVLLKSVWPGQSNGEAMGKSDRSQKHVPWLRWLNEVPEVTQVELVNHGVPV